MDLTILSLLAALALVVALVERAPSSRAARFFHLQFGPSWNLERSNRANYLAAAAWFLRVLIIVTPLWVITGWWLFRRPYEEPNVAQLVLFYFLMFFSLMSLGGCLATRADARHAAARVTSVRRCALAKRRNASLRTPGPNDCLRR